MPPTVELLWRDPASPKLFDLVVEPARATGFSGAGDSYHRRSGPSEYLNILDHLGRRGFALGRMTTRLGTGEPSGLSTGDAIDVILGPVGEALGWTAGHYDAFVWTFGYGSFAWERRHDQEESRSRQ